jgi:hypothetical protein
VYRFAMHRQQADKLEEREREVALQPARSNATKSRVKREVCSLSLSTAGMMQLLVGPVPWSMQERQQDGEVAIDSSFSNRITGLCERRMHACMGEHSGGLTFRARIIRPSSRPGHLAPLLPPSIQIKVAIPKATTCARNLLKHRER